MVEDVDRMDAVGSVEFGRLNAVVDKEGLCEVGFGGIDRLDAGC